MYYQYSITNTVLDASNGCSPLTGAISSVILQRFSSDSGWHPLSTPSIMRTTDHGRFVLQMHIDNCVQAARLRPTDTVNILQRPKFCNKSVECDSWVTSKKFIVPLIRRVLERVRARRSRRSRAIQIKRNNERDTEITQCVSHNYLQENCISVWDS